MSSKLTNRRHGAAVNNNKAPTLIGIGTSTKKENASKPLQGRPTTEEIPLYGTFLYPTVSKYDAATPLSTQRVYVGIAILSLALLPMVPSLMVKVVGLDGTWDAQHNINIEPSVGLLRASASAWWWPSTLDNATQLIKVTMGVDDHDILLAGTITAAFFGILLILDAAIHHVVGITNPWSSIYYEMFAEPIRQGRLIRRLGNTLSNALYLFQAVLLLQSTIGRHHHHHDNLFVVGDAMFGIMLFVLALSSTFWHSSNTPFSQYIDLWSMDACIIYLILRTLSVGLYILVLRAAQHFNNQEMAAWWEASSCASWVCVLLYLYRIVARGKMTYRRYQSRWLHGHCPFAIRARLASSVTIHKQQQQQQQSRRINANGGGESSTERNNSTSARRSTSFDTPPTLPPDAPAPIGVLDICLYANLPVLYMLLPIFVMGPVMQTIGSKFAAEWTCGSLVVGWSYRMWERWALDGCAPSNFVQTKMLRNNGTNSLTMCLWTVAGAVVSPTSVLHIMTGVTLIAGYAHVRSMELSITTTMV
jgi:hypothetical protein